MKTTAWSSKNENNFFQFIEKFASFVCNKPINQTITWCHDVMGPRLYSMLYIFDALMFCFDGFRFYLSVVPHVEEDLWCFYFTFFFHLILFWLFNPRSSRLCINMNTSIRSPSLFGWYFCVFRAISARKQCLNTIGYWIIAQQFEMFGSNVSCWILLFI